MVLQLFHLLYEMPADSFFLRADSQAGSGSQKCAPVMPLPSRGVTMETRSQSRFSTEDKGCRCDGVMSTHQGIAVVTLTNFSFHFGDNCLPCLVIS